MRTKKADESGKWWAGTKTTWAIKSGSDWWLIPGSEFPEKKINNQKKHPKNNPHGQKSLLLDKNYLFLIVISSLLGVSLALNVLHYLLK